MNAAAMVKETIIENGQPIEVVLYAPAIGIVYVAAVGLQTEEQIEKMIQKLGKANPIYKKTTILQEECGAVGMI